jgi:hypothetical protein
MEFLAALRQDVEITVRPTRKKHAALSMVSALGDVALSGWFVGIRGGRIVAVDRGERQVQAAPINLLLVASGATQRKALRATFYVGAKAPTR